MRGGTLVDDGGCDCVWETSPTVDDGETSGCVDCGFPASEEDVCTAVVVVSGAASVVSGDGLIKDSVRDLRSEVDSPPYGPR